MKNIGQNLNDIRNLCEIHNLNERPDMMEISNLSEIHNLIHIPQVQNKLARRFCVKIMH